MLPQPSMLLAGGGRFKSAEKLRAQILEAGADILGVPAEEAEFDGKQVLVPGSGKSISLREIGYITCNGSRQLLSVHESHSSPISPPPFMVGMAEVDIDPQTGKVNLMDYVAVVDCGTVINKNLARVQTEGGIAQGIGMALYEDIQYNEDGKMINNSFLQYKIPTVWKFQIFGLPSKAAMNQQVHSVQNPSVSWLSILHPLQLQVQSAMQQDLPSQPCQLPQNRLRWDFLKILFRRKNS